MAVRRSTWLIPGALAAGILILLAVLPGFLPTARWLEAARSDLAGQGLDLQASRAELRLLPRPTIVLGQGGIESRPGAAVRPFRADWTSLRSGVAVLPLLRGSVALTDITGKGDELVLLDGEQTLVLKGYDLAGLDWSRPPPGTETATGGVSGTVRLRADQVEWRRLTGRELEIEGAVAERELTIDSAALRLGEGSLSLRGIWVTGHPIRFLLEGTNLDGPTVLGAISAAEKDRLTGALDLVAAGTWIGPDGPGADPLAGLRVEGRLTAADGILHAADWLQEALPYLGERRDLVDIRYDRLRIPFLVADSRCTLDLAIDGTETVWRGSGWIDFAGPMDLDLQAGLPPGFTPDLGQWSFVAESLRNAEGRVVLAFGLAGPADRPSFRLDLGGLLAGSRQAPEPRAEKGWAGLLDKWKSR